MKRILVVLTIVVFGCSKINAQELRFGAKVGINFSDILGDNTLRDGPITSIPMFAVYAEIPLYKKFSFQPELQYSPQGFGTGSGNNEVISLNYLNVPLLGKCYIFKGLSLEAGPQVGVLLDATLKETAANIADNFKTLDFGVNLGIGYTFNNGLNLGFRYNLGVSNINDAAGTTENFSNATGQLTIGYSFF